MLTDTIRVDQDILFRRATLADAPALFALEDANRNYLRRWLAWVDERRTEEDERQWLDFQLGAGSRWQDPLLVYFRGDLVGKIDLFFVTRRDRAVEIDYWLAEDFQGQGIITRSLISLLDQLFTKYGINRVMIRAATGNTKSRAIPERLGFVLEGIQRQAELVGSQFQDLAMYSMLAGEWQNGRDTK